jgi:hypothetical protein
MSRSISRRAAASLVAWLVGTAVATGVGLLTIRLLGEGLTANTVQPLSTDAVRDALAETASPSGRGTPASARTPGSTAAGTNTPGTPTPDRPPATTRRPVTTTPRSTQDVLSSVGGTVVARCTGSTVSLISSSPEQGFEVHDVRAGPASVAEVEFRSDSLRVEMTITCAGGTPRATNDERSESGGKGGRGKG